MPSVAIAGEHWSECTSNTAPSVAIAGEHWSEYTSNTAHTLLVDLCDDNF